MKTINNYFIKSALFLFFIMNLGPASLKAASNIVNKVQPTSAESILQKYDLSAEHVSLLLVDEKNRPIFAVNEQTKKIPASISKLLTTYAVAKNIALNNRFATKLFYDGKNLYLKGGGDPSFVSENMWFLVNEFFRAGIKNISGNVVVDDTLFDRVRFDASREDKRVDRAYDSPVGAMSFNWNAVNIYVKPSKLGEVARVVVDPDNGFFKLVNNTKTTTSTKKELVVSISNASREITVSGDVLLDSKEKAIFKSITDPDIWAGVNLVEFLKQRGITVNGKVVAGKTPESAELVATNESKPLPYILSDMNKFSNNFVAEMLTKNLAAQSQKSFASLSKGVEVIREELANIGITEKEMYIENPSGLTRKNQFSAQAMVRLLSEIKRDFSIYPTVLEGLPVAGVDGTLKNRFKNTTLQSWIRAKTGYLDGVVSLAGYGANENGQVFTFAFLYNGPRDEAKVREAFDQILLNSIK